MTRKVRAGFCALFLAGVLAGCGNGDAATGSVASQGHAGTSGIAGHVVGLSTSLPIAWRESGDIRELLSLPGEPGTDGDEDPSATGAEAHWAKAVLSSGKQLVMLDTLSGAGGALPLGQEALLVLAQPRPLMAQENVALDDWVREGGHVLLFADPMLTGHSRFALGDPRRPQDVVLLSPILGRWGLELQFDDRQDAGERLIETPFGSFPVNLAGRFAISGTSGDEAGTGGDEGAKCRLEGGGLLAQCQIGKGGVLAVADAALLENSHDSTDSPRRVELLQALLARALALK